MPQVYQFRDEREPTDFKTRQVSHLARESAHEPSHHLKYLRGMLPDAPLNELDTFDRLQLESVVGVCRRSRSIAEAGRALFGSTATGCSIIARCGRPVWGRLSQRANDSSVYVL
jgi:sigma54-dependent transcription regulator